MESNGHDEPFKDKSNMVDTLPSPQASPLPDLPPRRKSLVGLKGIAASRRSMWENRLTTSVGQSGGNPLSQSMPCLNACESRTSSRSSVSPRKLTSKFGRKWSDQQENNEVSSKVTTDSKWQKQVLQNSNTNAIAETMPDMTDACKTGVAAQPQPQLVEEKVEQPVVTNETAPQPAAPGEFDQQAPNTAAECIIPSDQDASKPVQESTAPPVENTAHMIDTPIVPTGQNAPETADETSAQVVGNTANTVNEFSDEAGQVASTTPGKEPSTAPAEVGKTSTTSTPKTKQPDQPYWKRFTNVWKRTPLTEKKPQVERAPVEASLCTAGASPVALTNPKPATEAPVTQDSAARQATEVPSPGDGQATSVASPAQEMQSPASVESLSPNYSEARESEPRRCSEVKMMTLQCMSDHIQDMTTYSAGQDIDVSLDSTFDKAAAQQAAISKDIQENADAAAEDAAQGVEDAAVGRDGAAEPLEQHLVEEVPDRMDVDNTHSTAAVQDMADSALVSPSSQRIVVSTSIEEAPAGPSSPIPASFAVDVSLDGQTMMPDPDVVMTETDAGASAGSPVASDSPKRIPEPSVTDSFSFGGPPKKPAAEDTAADQQVVASLAQMPFGGLASHTQHPATVDSLSNMGAAVDSLSNMGAADDSLSNMGAAVDSLSDMGASNFTLPQLCEEPTSFGIAPASRALDPNSNFVQVSLADGCGVDLRMNNSVQVSSAMPDTEEVAVPDMPAQASLPLQNADEAQNGSDHKPVMLVSTAPALPPRHPSPPPSSAGVDVPPLNIRPGLPPAKDLSIREAVEQVVQSSPTAKQRPSSAGGTRRGVGLCGDSIPLFVKDLPTENLLDDTSMEDWLSPSKTPTQNFNGLLDQASALGDSNDIEKVLESFRSLEGADPTGAHPAAQAEASCLGSPFTAKQSPSQQKELDVPKGRQSVSPQPSLVRPSSAHKSPVSTSASKQTASPHMKSPRNATAALNKSPRGLPTASSKAGKSQPSAHSLRSPRGLPTASTAAAAAATNTNSSPLKSPRKTLLSSSGSKSPQPSTAAAAAAGTASKTAAAPKSARGTGVSSLVPKTPRGTGQAVPTKTPRGTTVSGIPKVSQRSSNLPSAPGATPRGTASSLPSARGTGVSRLGGAKVTQRGALPSAPGKTPRELPSTAPAVSSKPNLVSSNRSPGKAKEVEPASSGATTPRQVSMKRPLSSPASGNRLRTGRPQPVTPRADRTDVDMEEAHHAGAESGPQIGSAKTSVIPKLNLKSLAAVPESREPPIEPTAEDMEVCVTVNQPAGPPAPPTSDAIYESMSQVAKTPGPSKATLEVNATALEAWTPELYMAPAETPAAARVTQGKGLGVYNANLQSTPFQQLSKVRLDAAVNAPLVDSSPLSWDDDFGTDTQRIIMQLATSPAPMNLGAGNVSASEDKAPHSSPAPNSLIQMQVQMLLQQVSEYKAKVQQLEGDNLALKDQISTLQFGKEFDKEDDDFEKDARLYAEAELQKTQAQNAQLTSKVQTLEQETQGARREVAELQKTVQQLAASNGEMESERNKAQDQVGLMEVEITALRSALSEVQQQLAIEQNQVSELNALLSKERDERVKLIKENHDSKKDLKKLLEQLISAQTEHQVAKKEVEKANGLVSKLQQQKDAEIVKVAQLTSDLAKAKAENKELAAMCSELLTIHEAQAGARPK